MPLGPGRIWVRSRRRAHPSMRMFVEEGDGGIEEKKDERDVNEWEDKDEEQHVRG